MSLQTLLPPASDPVSLDEAKVFLHVDSSHEDALLADLIRAATETVERRTGLTLIARTLQQTIKSWPDKGLFILQARPLMQLLKVQSVDFDGTTQLVDPTTYYVDINSSRLIALSTFPHLSFTHPSQAILVDFIAGYGALANTIPSSLRMAVLLIVRDLFEHRGAHDGPLPLRAQALLAPFTEVRL